jgi:hypothetical protein
VTTPHPERQENREAYGPPLADPAYTAYHQPGYDDPVPPPQPYAPQPYGQAYSQPYGVPLSPLAAPPAGVNGFAVASFVLSFCVGGFLLLSIIFGLVALRQIDRNGQSGKGFAITGLMISLLWILGIAGAYFYSNYQDAKQQITGTITAEQTVPVSELKTGDCVKSMPQAGGVLFTVVVLPCALAHQGEVAGEFTISGTRYPGEAGVEAQALEQCEPIVRQYTSPATIKIVTDIYYVGPRSADWDKGRRTVTCIAMTAASQTGSVKG